MIWRRGFAYERFDPTKPVFEGGPEKIGSLIVGLPEGQSPQFELCDEAKNWQQILGQVLTPEELEELGRQFGCKISERTRFWPRLVLDFWPILETAPSFESRSGKRFWVFSSYRLGHDPPGSRSGYADEVVFGLNFSRLHNVSSQSFTFFCGPQAFGILLGEVISYF